MGKEPDQIREDIGQTRDRMSGTVDALAYKADVPSRVKESLSDTVGSVTSAVTGTSAKMTSAVTDAAGRTTGMIKENPLGLLFSGVAIGFVLGSLLPATDLENEQLGELKENLTSQALDAGNQAIERGRAAVGSTDT